VRKVHTKVLVLFFVSCLTLFPLLGKTYRFELVKTTALNGVDLRAGIYTLEINSTQTRAEIYNRGKLAVTAQVEVKPLGNSTRETVLIGRDGTLSEYRSSREKILFVNASSQALPSGSSK